MNSVNLFVKKMSINGSKSRKRIQLSSLNIITQSLCRNLNLKINECKTAKFNLNLLRNFPKFESTWFHLVIGSVLRVPRSSQALFNYFSFIEFDFNVSSIPVLQELINTVNRLSKTKQIRLWCPVFLVIIWSQI